MLCWASSPASIAWPSGEESVSWLVRAPGEEGAGRPGPRSPSPGSTSSCVHGRPISRLPPAAFSKATTLPMVHRSSESPEGTAPLRSTVGGPRPALNQSHHPPRPQSACPSPGGRSGGSGEPAHGVPSACCSGSDPSPHAQSQPASHGGCTL